MASSIVPYGPVMDRNLRAVRKEAWSLKLISREPLRFEIEASPRFAITAPTDPWDVDGTARHAIERALQALAHQPPPGILEFWLRKTRATATSESDHLERAVARCRDALWRRVTSASKAGGFLQVDRLSGPAGPLGVTAGLRGLDEALTALKEGWPSDASEPSEAELSKAVKYAFSSTWRPMPAQDRADSLVPTMGDDYRVAKFVQCDLLASEPDRAKTIVFRLFNDVVDRLNAGELVYGSRLPQGVDKLSLGLWAFDFWLALKEPMVRAARSAGVRGLVTLLYESATP